MAQVLVLYDLEAQLGDELALKAGDIIKNVKKSTAEGWSEGKLNGKKGFFPNSFVKEIPPCFMDGKTQTQPRSLRKSHVLKKKQRWCEVTFPYSPVKQDELELKAGEIIEVLKEIEDGWWLGSKSGMEGVFPSNFVIEIKNPNPDAKSGQSGDFLHNWGGKQCSKLADSAFFERELEKQPMTQDKSSEPGKSYNLKVKEYCKVMFNYTATAEDELDLTKGDLVLILNKEEEDEGWWVGEINGKQGLFPDNYVMLLPSEFQHKKENLPPRAKTQKIAHEQKEHKELKTDAASKLLLPPVKKMAPPPPPVKAKPNLNLIRANGELPPLPFKTKETSKEKSSETDADGLDSVVISSEKLSHPTVNRPKMQKRRPPTQLFSAQTVADSMDWEPKKEESSSFRTKPSIITKSTEKPAVPPGKRKSNRPAFAPAKSPPPTQSKRATSPLKPNPAQSLPEMGMKAEPNAEDRLTVEELKSEIQALRMSLDLLKNHHV
nr:PREDICTED: SH3 domain-containing protein 21 isoform X1 [Latimeria chalumnae]|eukprot:XP_005988596.1 PREDICTED: SH3 domain-containing protein 21 isoform X1 [Latimeria chalumnae]